MSENLIETIMDLTGRLGVKNINQLPGAWEQRIDDAWHIAINGHDTAVTVKPDGSMSIDLDPFMIAVWFNGWLAGLFSPMADGVFAAGTAANEGTFIEAVGKFLDGVEAEEAAR